MYSNKNFKKFFIETRIQNDASTTKNFKRFPKKTKSLSNKFKE